MKSKTAKTNKRAWVAELEAEYRRIEKLRERADKDSNDGMIEWHLNCAGVAMGDAINRSRSATHGI